jgi:hypothetical protein
MKTIVFAGALALALGTAASAAWAGPVAAGFDSTSIPACDDCSAPANPVSPGFAMNFYGTTYNEFFVNNNGNITFAGDLPTYTPFGLGAGYTGQPIIAPFFADVDTRGAGSALTQYGTGTYNGFQAFGVTWPGVGYYQEHTDLLNDFQLILTNRSDTGAGNFDIYFNYNSVNWETGDASNGNGGFGGTPAAAGFSAGTAAPGTFFQLPGSLVSGALVDGGVDALASNTNDGVTGQYLFQVRNGSVAPPPPAGGVPEPATWAMLITGFGMIGTGLRLRRRRALAA